MIDRAVAVSQKTDHILAIGSFWNKNYAIQNLTAGDVYSTD
jgi:hypothetical protein